MMKTNKNKNKRFTEQQLSEQDYKTLVTVAKIMRVIIWMFKLAMLPWYIMVKLIEFTYYTFELKYYCK